MDTTRPVNILLVDDYMQNLMALSAVLNNPAYHLVKATSGAQALSLLLKHDFAVILLDVMMPEMDGYEVASIMKSREKTKTTPIIFVTGIARELRDIYRGYSVGAVDYIQKPLDPDVVRAKVAVFVDLYRSKEEIKRQSDIIQNSERAKFLELEQEARLRAEAAEKRYHDLINWVDHAVLWEYDALNRKFAFVSRRSSKILGFPPEEFLNDPNFFFSIIPPEHVEPVRKLFDEAITEGKAGRYEHHLINNNGEQIWVHTGVNPRKDASGKVTLLWGLTLDITPFKTAEENQHFLAQASAIFSSTLDYHVTLEKVAQLSVPMLGDWCTVDITQGEKPVRIVSVQGSRDKRESAAEIQVKYRPGGPIKSPILKVIETGKPLLFHTLSDQDLVSFAQNGEHLALIRKVGFKSLLVVPLKARGSTFGAITLAWCTEHRHYTENDLTFVEELASHAALAIDNSRLFHESQNAIRLRENVLGIVSHDLKSPLTSIGLKLQMIARGGKSDPKTIAKDALRSTERMNRMIRDLLDLSRIEADQMKYEMLPHRVEMLVAEAMETMQPIAVENSIQITQTILGPNLIVNCDRDRLHQVICNIVGNAVKFSSKGGTVKIGAEAEDGKVHFWVSDTGSGISKDQLSHIFDPFWQGQSEKKDQGTGLGLYITKRMLEAHSGEIRVDSEVGKGTTVHFTIPQAVSQAERKTA